MNCLLFALLILTFLPTAMLPQKGSRGGRSSGSRSSSGSVVHVRGYTRRDGNLYGTARTFAT
jgi:hypothetical protein